VAYPLYKVIGLGRATELALTGNAIGAAEAHRIGLVSSVHEDHELLPHAMDLARQMANRPPEALFETKRLTREIIELDTDAAFTRMFEGISARLNSREHQEALSAYMERLKRPRAGTS
jgi:enoyl-CoA hydratase/carnithine racemase